MQKSQGEGWERKEHQQTITEIRERIYIYDPQRFKKDNNKQPIRDLQRFTIFRNRDGTHPFLITSVRGDRCEGRVGDDCFIWEHFFIFAIFLIFAKNTFYLGCQKELFILVQYNIYYHPIILRVLLWLVSLVFIVTLAQSTTPPPIHPPLHIIVSYTHHILSPSSPTLVLLLL
jgi:hypothetical protein